VNFARLCQEGLTGFDRFLEILAVEPDIADAPGAIELARVRGDIAFRNVSFRYGEDYGDVLQGISLDLRAGETVALVGSSGVGKTTLCALIPRFYDVTAGAILLDEQDIRTIRLSSLRRRIGVVQQDVYLFSGTVAENIAYGRPGASRAEVIAAARQAHAHEFIQALPHGYDTHIGQRGVRLSGGQKQRLSLARVFLKDPPILILDEATSALDYESERAVQAALETLARGRTTLIIAHRLSTIRNAQRIVVLTGSGIEAQGTHAELLARGGAYAILWDAQWAVEPAVHYSP
jgi:ATP-binding cassette subfamily B protein